MHENLFALIHLTVKHLSKQYLYCLRLVYRFIGVNCGIHMRYIAPTPSAQHVVVIPKEGDAQLWHTMGNTRVQTFQGHQKPIKCLNINKNPQLLVTGSEDLSVLVWDLNTYALVAKYTWVSVIDIYLLLSFYSTCQFSIVKIYYYTHTCTKHNFILICNLLATMYRYLIGNVKNSRLLH